MMITLSLFFLGSISTIMAMITLILQRKHLLNALLSLEIMVLGLYILMIASLTAENTDLFITFIILTFGACEASVGLALLVALIRSHGNDFIKSMNLHKC